MYMILRGLMTKVVICPPSVCTIGP